MIYQNILHSYRKLDFDEVNKFLDLLDKLTNKNVLGEIPFPTPPNIIKVPVTDGFVYKGTNNKFTWKVYDQNPFYYDILVNGTVMSSDKWNNTSDIAYNFIPTFSGFYNITAVFYDVYNTYSKSSILIVVGDSSFSNSESNPSSSPANTSFPIIYSLLCLLIVNLIVKLKKIYK